MSEESTTPDLVERTRASFEAAIRGDFDTWTSFVDPDIVRESRGLGTRLTGVAAVRGFREEWVGAYEDFRAEIEEILDLGNGVVLLLYYQSGRPRGSVGEVGQRNAAVIVWAEGLAVRVIFHYDIEEARAEAERLAASGE